MPLELSTRLRIRALASVRGEQRVGGTPANQLGEVVERLLRVAAPVAQGVGEVEAQVPARRDEQSPAARGFRSSVHARGFILTI